MPINVEHVTVYAPQQSSLILHDITCQLEQNQITLLLGRTGAGKSTLLDTLSGLIKIDQGKVLYDQASLWKGKRINAAVQFLLGNVFQYPEQQLFAQTVKREFDYSLQHLKLEKPLVQQRSLAALNEMGLPSSLMQEAPLILSGGQKRRVALACTFSTQPEWLFLDEPTAGLDSETAQKLLTYLSAWKHNTRGGIVIATHDLDTLLPIADSVIVMKQGRLLCHTTSKELYLHPHVLLEAEIGIPTSIELSMLLSERGISIADSPLSPRQYADCLLQRLCELHSNRETPLPLPPVTENNDRASIPSFVETANQKTTLGRTTNTADEHFVYTLDPRSKWLFYLLISIGIIVQNSWTGLLFGSIVCIATVLFTRVASREIMPVIKPFVLLIVLSVLLSGIRFDSTTSPWHLGSVYFSIQAALLTLTQLYKILLIMILGILLPATTSQLKMKRGLERSLSFLHRLRLPVEAFSLGASLMLHFIPVIMKEAQRFSRITQARGKRITKIGTVRLRDVGALIIPLIISVLQLGSDLALAMEARGYAQTGLKRTSSYNLKLQKTDMWTISLSLVLFALFVGISYAIR
ncbi:MAG TPA: ATP-binding cassette domain-containing protein [Ktedonobacteraceae bacterium]|nr:ATP-binding cassette domain-containing protein [Ktedonobacteraceae bacterium]